MKPFNLTTPSRARFARPFELSGAGTSPGPLLVGTLTRVHLRNPLLEVLVCPPYSAARDAPLFALAACVRASVSVLTRLRGSLIGRRFQGVVASHVV